MKIPLGKPIFDSEMETAAIEALRNERFVLGESVHKFEEEFAKYCGTDYAVSTSSGTAALQLSLTATGLKSGDVAITSPASFIASANAIVHAQGTPLFADVDMETYNVNPQEVLKVITPKTKAIVPVHLYGYPADIDSISEIVQKKKISVIEDACQAHGASFNGKKVGSLGEIGCFSFYPSKNMTVCGDGGMITTNNEKIASIVYKLRDCGRKSQYIHDVIGYTSRLNTVNAAVGRIQLKRLDAWIEKRRKIADVYHRLLGGIKDLTLPPKGSTDVQPVYHLYVIRTKQRDQLKQHLETSGVSCGVHYALPIHLQPVYQEMYGFTEGVYPNAEQLCKTCLSLPMYPDLSQKEIEVIADSVCSFFS